jgi:hypothetical protein
MKQNTPKSLEKDQSNSNSSNSEIRKENLNHLPKQPFESTASKTAEQVGFGESAEVQGEVSEGVREQSEQKGDSVKGSRKKDDRAAQMTAAQIKAQLLKSAPSEKIILKQVKREIEKEIRYLNKRARKILRKPGSISAFEINNVVKKIRELKALLIALSKATADVAKTLWLRFVHGVM